MRAAVYLRVSTEDQARHGYSLPSQRAACTEKAQELGADEVVEFCDEGVSGEILSRPGITALREAAAKGEIDLIVCYDPEDINQYAKPEFDTTEAFRAMFLKSDPLISRVSGFGSGEKAKKA